MRTYSGRHAALDEDELEEEKKASLADSDYEPLKMYLKEMGNIPPAYKRR